MESKDVTESTVSEFYEHDHDQLDESFEEYRQLKDSDFETARDHFMEFYRGLKTHIKWEEEVMFPEFEDKMREGLTGTMRREHEQIQEVLEALREMIEQGDVPEDRLDRKLLKFLNPHNESEEAVVYPAIDRHLSDGEIKQIFDRMEDFAE
ncbi:MAG: hemerythrin domain-containing protein [bacterium]